ncbi:MAG TPA: PAS domain S-box protein, partial [Candidatus Sulfotelmatobacter sp.]|nr:PAS domain S-box protein [Candidatus Sulfotelmatobacter sp.]
GNLLPLEQWPISRALRGETFTGYQVQVRRLDGSREWFASYSGAPVRNPQGQMVLGIVTFHDITELRRAEAALGRRVEQQEILSQALAQLLSTDDPKELVRELFPQVAAHLGVDTFFNFMLNERGEALYLNAYGGVPEQTARRIHRLEFGQAICGAVAQTREPIVVMDVQNSSEERAGLIRSLGIRSYACYPLATAGQLLGTLSFASHTRTHFDPEEFEFLRLISSYAAVALDRARTTQALRESERQFRGTFENAAVGIANVGLEGQWLAVNQKLCDIVGYRREELLQRSFQSITYSEDLGADLAQFERLRRGEMDTYDQEKRYVHKDGHLIWIHLTVGARRDEEGRLLYCVSVIQDITARKQAEAALRQSEERHRVAAEELRAIMDATPGGLLVTHDPECRLMTGNAPAHEILGVPLEENISATPGAHESSPYFRIYRQGREAVGAELPMQVAGMTGVVVHDEELEVVRRDGTRRTMLVTAAPLYSSEGRIRGAVGAVVDITERKQAEEALRQSEEKFRAVFEQAAVGMGRVSFTDARWIDVNDAFCRMLGYTREEMRAIPWPQMTHPEDVDLDLIPFRRMAAGELESYIIEKRFIHKNGQPVWARLTLSIVRDIQGRPDHEVAVIEDITERKQAEQALQQSERALRQQETLLRTVLGLLPVGIWIFDAQGTVVQNNPAAATIWSSVRHEADEAYGEYRGRQEDTGQRLGPQDWVVTRVLSGTDALLNEEIQMEGVDETTKIILISALPIQNREGAITGAVMLNEDITERKQYATNLERTVNERTAKLREAMAEMEQMSYSMIHDMRAPLRAIQSFGGILAEDSESHLSAEGRDMVAKMRTAADRMDHFICDVLDYSKVVREELPLKPLNVAALARSIVETYPGLQPPETDITIAQDLPLILGNEAAMTQCLSQLFQNAVKFSKPGQVPRIAVKGGRVSNGWARVVVEDNGIGIPPELHEQIFGMFQRLSNSGEGTGIGLAIVKKAVERMDGRVGVDSEPGQGSRFWIELRTEGLLADAHFESLSE